MAKRTARPLPEVREARHQAAREDLHRPHRTGGSPWIPPAIPLPQLRADLYSSA
jgi:hypothetical protein